MPTRNALATARLQYTPGAGNVYRVSLRVWSHSYDHPSIVQRSALVTGVYLTQLQLGPNFDLTNVSIQDRYGVDHTGLWMRTSAAIGEGWDGYTEGHAAGSGGQPNTVYWAAHTGIYDERCLADPAVDRCRLQTYRLSGNQVDVFNYLLGPVTFAFQITLAAPPKAVLLRLGHIGGNGGNPAQRTATLPDEEMVIQFP